MKQHATGAGTTLLTIPEAAKELRVSKATIYRLIEKQKLAPTHVGFAGYARISRAELQRYIDSHTRKAAS